MSSSCVSSSPGQAEAKNSWRQHRQPSPHPDPWLLPSRRLISSEPGLRERGIHDAVAKPGRDGPVVSQRHPTANFRCGGCQHSTETDSQTVQESPPAASDMRKPPKHGAILSGTPIALLQCMKHLMLVALVLLPATLLLGCDEPEDCGNPFGCGGGETSRMTSGDVGELFGANESTIAVLLDEHGYTPELDEDSDELLYTLSADDLEGLAVAAAKVGSNGVARDHADANAF